MEQKGTKKENICGQAGEEAVIFLQNWKKKLRRNSICKGCAVATLFCVLAVLTHTAVYHIDKKIPSQIYVRANEEQSIALDVPARAQILSTDGQEKTNINGDSITVDLSKPLTVKAGELSKYAMEVKLFGFLPFKKVDIQVIRDQQLIPAGVPVGIYLKTQGVLVAGVGEFAGADGEKHAPAKNLLETGDYIVELNGEKISEKKEFMKKIETSGGAEQILTVARGGGTVKGASAAGTEPAGGL